MKKIRILTFTPVWRRPQVFEICLKGLKRLQEYKPETFAVRPFFIVSEPAAAEQVERYGFDFIYWENKPLGLKKNMGLRYAMNSFDFDYLMEVGSDDLIANSLLDVLNPYFTQETPQITPQSVWFIDVVTGKAAFWTTSVVLGAGRCISRAALELFSPAYELWEPLINRGMDSHSWRNLQKKGIGNILVPLRSRVYNLDLKSEVNINSLDVFLPAYHSVRKILSHFPEAEDVMRLINQNKSIV